MRAKLKNFLQIIVAVVVFFVPSLLNSQALKNKTIGRAPAPELKFRQAGVPVFDLVEKRGNEVAKVKVIPRLDIGEERAIEAESLTLKPIPAMTLKLTPVQERPSPTPILLSASFKPLLVEQIKMITSPEQVSAVQSVLPLSVLPTPIVTQTEIQPEPVVEIKNDEFKMLQALIFLEHKKKFDLAMALFVELMSSPQFKDQATFHYAETALGLELFSEFRNKMILVAKQSTNKDLKIKAVQSLVKNIEYLENSDIGLIDPLTEAFEIETSSNPKYSLRKAKYYSELGQLGEFEAALLAIPIAAPEYKESILLKAIFNYRQGLVDAAISDLEMLWPSVEANKKDQIRNLSALTLARLYFQKGDYKSAYKSYLNVDKSSGQWLQSMVEQAWTQVLAGDHEGAAGNMFSLHTDFFKKAYSPDTYIVRTVGYLNLCQFGDSVSVLNDLKKKYQNVLTKLTAYQSTNKDPLKYYDLIKFWMKNTNLTEIDGVPRTFIVELARHPNYMLLQKQINNYEDENSKFNRITVDLIRKERVARLDMLKSKNEMNQAKREKSNDATTLEQKYLGLAVEHLIYSRARDGIKKMREEAVARIEKEEDAVRLKAATNLKNRFDTFASTLDSLIDQKEVLSYEIYSGAGEHIRFQMAGGEVDKNRATAALVPEEDNSYKWKHKGEVWEDEIGHYRSSLKNVCPSDEGIAQNILKGS